MFKAGNIAIAEWHAKLAGGSWHNILQAITDSLSDFPSLNRCGIGCTSQASLDDCSARNTCLQRARSLTSLVLGVAGKLCWYMLPYSEVPPNSFATSLHPNSGSRGVGMKQTQTTWTNVCTLAQDTPKIACKLLGDLYWPGNLLTHEAMDMFASQGWCPNSKDIRELGYDLFAGVSDTTLILENVFGTLTTVARRNNNLRMSSYHA